MRAFLATAAIVLSAGAAGAQDYPDLTGTWTGEVKLVKARPDPADVMGDATTVVTFEELPVRLVIEQQDGGRFAGMVSGETWTKPLVGSIGADGRLLWVQPAGHVEAHLGDDGVLHYCYLEGEDLRLMSACASLERQ